MLNLGVGVTALAVLARPAVLPALQTVPFGSKDRVGYGEHDLGYTGAGYLGITAGNGAGHFAINSRNCLCPANGANAYASAAPTFAGPYTLTVTEYSDSGKTTPTGLTSIVTVTIHTDRYYVRFIASGTNADTASSFQLRTIASSSDDLFGKTIYVRGAIANAGFLDMRLRRAASPGGTWSGSNWTVVRPEVDYGCTMTRMSYEGQGAAGGRPFYLHFRYFNMSLKPSDTGASNVSTFIQSCMTNATWLKWSNNRFYSDTTSTDGVNTATGIYIQATITGGVLANLAQNITVTDNDFTDLYAGMNISGIDLTIASNRTRRIWSDCLKMTPVGNDDSGDTTALNWLVEGNEFADQMYGDGGVHGDFIQVNTAAYHATNAPQFIGTYSGITIRKNRLMRGVGRPGFSDGQGFFINESGNQRFTNVLVEESFVQTTFARGISLANCDNPTVRRNTVVSTLQPSALVPTIALVSCSTGTVEKNIAGAAVTQTTPLSAPTISDHIIADKDAASGSTSYGAIFNAPAYGSDCNTAAKAAAAWSPRLTGVAALASSLWAGAILPSGADNVGAAYP